MLLRHPSKSPNLTPTTCNIFTSIFQRTFKTLEIRISLKTGGPIRTFGVYNQPQSARRSLNYEQAAPLQLSVSGLINQTQQTTRPRIQHSRYKSTGDVPYYINLDEVEVQKELFSRDTTREPAKSDIPSLLENWRVKKFSQSFHEGSTKRGHQRKPSHLQAGAPTTEPHTQTNCKYPSYTPTVPRISQFLYIRLVRTKQQILIIMNRLQ